MTPSTLKNFTTISGGFMSNSYAPFKTGCGHNGHEVVLNILLCSLPRGHMREVTLLHGGYRYVSAEIPCLRFKALTYSEIQRD